MTNRNMTRKRGDSQPLQHFARELVALPHFQPLLTRKLVTYDPEACHGMGFRVWGLGFWGLRVGFGGLGIVVWGLDLPTALKVCALL